MGTLWVVWPLDHDLRAWLDEHNIAYPAMPSRFPTGDEIKEVLKSLTGYTVEIDDNGIGGPWRALIAHGNGCDEGPWTVLNIAKYSGDDLPQVLCFEKGWDSAVKEIVRRLTTKCGPLVLFADSGCEPEIMET